jgi:vacuolar-type H+-ATPase subunit H
MIEQDVIGHLIDVERLASDMLLDAQAEADRRKAAAKERAEAEYLKAYESLVASLESSFKAATREKDESRDRAYAAFDAEIASVPRDPAAFASYLDGVLFG